MVASSAHVSDVRYGFFPPDEKPSNIDVAFKTQKLRDAYFSYWFNTRDRGFLVDKKFWATEPQRRYAVRLTLMEDGISMEDLRGVLCRSFGREFIDAQLCSPSVPH